jgi:anion-transporting  ArsA/GET3 family ATPase
MTPLFDRELLVIAGKGGVGRSTVTAGLGLLAARDGIATAMVEMNGVGSLPRLFGEHEPAYDGIRVREDLVAFNISSSEAMEEYLLRHIRFRALYELVFGNRFIAPFMNAVLGLSDLIALGKVMDLGWEVDRDGHRRHDLLLLDAPATGHGLTMLRAPRAMMEMARKGPLFQNAALVDELLSDPERAGMVLTTLPEEIPVNETLEMAETLARTGEVHVCAVVVNGVPSEPFPDGGEEAYRTFVAGPGSRAGGEMGRALREVERLLARRRTAQREIDRLRAALDVPMVEIPMLPQRELGPDSLAEVARSLEALP